MAVRAPSGLDAASRLGDGAGCDQRCVNQSNWPAGDRLAGAWIGRSDAQLEIRRFAGRCIRRPLAAQFTVSHLAGRLR